MDSVDYLIGVSHFAECRENRPAYSAMVREVDNHPESVSGTGSPPKVDQFFRLVGPSQKQVSMKSADCFGSNPAHRPNDRHAMSEKQHLSRNVRFG